MEARKERYAIIDGMPDDDFLELLSSSTGVGPAMKTLGVTHREFYRIIRERMERENITKEIFKKPVTNTARSQSSYRFEEIFCFPTQVSRGYPLKDRLYFLGLVSPFCVKCGREEGENRVKLQVDHISGVSNDNRLENLRLLCPNCHSLTDTYRARNMAEMRCNLRKDFYKGEMTKTSGNIHTNPAVKRRLIYAEGWEHCCSVCGTGPDKSIIELDHINGDNRDNRLENLRLLCLNCHTTTETYCRTKKINPKKFCHDCGKKCKGYRCKTCQRSLKTTGRKRKGIPCKTCGKETSSRTSKQCSYCYANRGNILLNESYREFITIDLFAVLPFF